ncbi:uncharacterized protein LOC142166116 [Nicotiana tabacum]|uniref:Uncharacterized protein LOC142166116 n=1 Tax=Nicotiana tabacum TaxID=4097 RepID=A0AC58S6M1_TOBAC
MTIVDRQVRKLRSKEIMFVKCLWRNHAAEEATWEIEDNMRVKYPYLFQSTGSSGILKLLDMPTSSVIKEYESIIITGSTPSSIEVGQVYQDKEIIATALKHYSVMHKFQFRVKRSSARSYWLICVGENCTWHFKATSINDSAMFKVRNFDSQHTCSLMDNTFIQRKPTAMVVGSIVIPKYSDSKTIYTPKDIQFDMLYEHGLNLTYMQAWREKEKALQFLRGHPADSYSKLPGYLYILVKTYPGPIVVVDGTFLKSAYKGIMLISSTMDAAGIILPLAYAVVDSENDASWKWYKFNKELDDNIILSHKLRVRASTDYIHIVIDGVRRYIVCLENKRCSCGQFQLDELPCPHALAALRHRNESFEQYCSPYYTRANLLRTYEIPLNPLPDESKWNVS